MRRLGREEGLEEGLKEGRAEGQAEGLRGAILDGIVYRFNPPAADYRNVEKELQTITSYPTLQRIHAALFETADFPAFRRRVEEELERG
jgi:flagellar biosynthesis/type III secretory pathway protein FliH